MKIELNFQKLKETVLLIDKIANKHLTLPVLSCILIEVKKNTATFKATNLDVGIEVSVPVKSNEDGVLAVPAGVLSSFVSQIINDNQVTKLETVSNNLYITTSKSKGTIKTVPPEDFPSIPQVIDGQNFTLASELFVKGLKSVWYSSSVSSVKPELSSVYIYNSENNLVFAATDSFRLAERKIKTTAATHLSDILIPFKNIPDIIRVLENMGENTEIQLSKNLISFKARDIYLVSRLIDGVFPDYRQIIPKNYSTEAVLLKQDLINALKISNIFSDKFNQIHLVIDPKAKIFEIQTKNNDVGENNTSVDAALTGEVQNSFTKEVVLRTTIKEAIKKHVGIDIPIENISPKNGIVTLKNISQSARSAIFIKKQKILGELKEVGILDLR
ncbi:MAG: DNA polymerase III subunit beta [Candidatus Woesebacteria bacterium]|nr:DNA polymerase III subunit beta [Candidatus Woesebacteria bacterium]